MMSEVDKRSKNSDEAEKEMKLGRTDVEDEEYGKVLNDVKARHVGVQETDKKRETEDEKRTGVDTKAELIRLLRRLENSLTEQRHSEKVRTA